MHHNATSPRLAACTLHNFVLCLRRFFCRHAFALRDLKLTGIPEPDKPAVPSNPLFNRAFMLGFMVSREGFNGECDYEHCAPSRVEAYCESIQEFAVRIEHNDMYRQLRDEAIAQMLNPTADRRATEKEKAHE